MKAIQVRFLPATSFYSARVKAFTEGGNAITVPFQYESSNFLDQAETAAQDLIYKMKWPVKISGVGTLPCGDCVVTIEGV